MDHQDAFWVERARRGDRAAFGLLVEKHTPMLQRLIARKIGQVDETHDLAQEAWLQAYLNLERLREPARFAGWLYGIALNVARMWQRQHRRAPPRWLALKDIEGFEQIDVRSNGFSVEEEIAARETQRMVLAAVEQLSGINREAVRLFYLYDLSYEEIAARLQVPIKTVKSRLHKARQQLKTHLQSQVELPAAMLAATEETSMHPATIYEVYTAQLDPDEFVPEIHYATVVVLKAQDQTRFVPIFVGSPEGESIARKLRHVQAPRPMTHDLMVELIRRLGGTVNQIQLSALRDNTFFATIELAKAGATETIDCRPSDALALALRIAAPIVVAPQVLDQAGRDEATAVLPDMSKVREIKPLELQDVFQPRLHTTTEPNPQTKSLE